MKTLPMKDTPHQDLTAMVCCSRDATKDEAVFVGVSGSPSDETPDRVMLIGYNEDGSLFSTFGTVNNPFGQAGISSKGFAFAMTSNTSETACDWGMSPEMACFYFASQCGSAAECREWLEKVPRSFATGNFLFADTEGDICVCETNNAHFNLRKPGDAGEEGNYVVSTNHFAAKETFDFNVPEMEMWKEDSVCRLAPFQVSGTRNRAGRCGHQLDSPPLRQHDGSIRIQRNGITMNRHQPEAAMFWNILIRHSSIKGYDSVLHAGTAAA